MKYTFFICIFFFVFFLLPMYAQEIEEYNTEEIEEYDTEEIEEYYTEEIEEYYTEEINSIYFFNFVKPTLLFGFHIPDEEFSEGYNFSVNISNSINEFLFFTFDLNVDRFYGVNTNKKKYTLDEVSIGIGTFVNLLKFQKNNIYLGVEFGSYHIKNTDEIKLETKNTANNLMIAWILGNSYSITEKITFEGSIRLKANHLKNLSINFGVGYKIIR